MKIIRNLSISVFMLCFLILLFPASAHAEELYPVTVGGVELTADSCYALTNADGTVTTDGASADLYNIYYDAANYTLYLDNATITGVTGKDGAVVLPGDTEKTEEAGKGIFKVKYRGINTLNGGDLRYVIRHNGGMSGLSATLYLSAEEANASLNINKGLYSMDFANLIMTGGTVAITDPVYNGLVCSGVGENKISGVNLTIGCSTEDRGIQRAGLEVFGTNSEKFLIEDSTISINTGSARVPAIAIPLTRLEAVNTTLNLTSKYTALMVTYGECKLDSCTGTINAPYGMYCPAQNTGIGSVSGSPFIDFDNCSFDINGGIYGIYTTGKVSITGAKSLIDGSDCEYVFYQYAGSDVEAKIDSTAIQGLGRVQTDTYYVWGNYTITKDMGFTNNIIVDEGAVLTIPKGRVLTVAGGYSLDNKGTVYICGTLEAASTGNPVTEHKYEDDEDCSTALVCELCQTMIAEAKSHVFDYKSDNNATCTADGTKSAKCKFCEVTSTITDEYSALGHDWGEPTWEWSQDGTTATVTFTCKNDNSHKETPKVTVTSKVTLADCTDDGEKVYTASATFNGKEYSAVNPVLILATGHTFSDKWQANEEKHWYECSCGAKTEESDHTFKWIVDKEASVGAVGSKHEECTVCGYAKAVVEIPALTESKSPAINDNGDVSGTKAGSGGKAVSTGDGSPIMLWLMFLAASGIILAGAGIYRRKRKEDN